MKLLGQRWYDSEVGRFISRDPIGEEGGMNLHVYVRNNVVNNIDPFGLQNKCEKFAKNPNSCNCQDRCDEICAADFPGIINCHEICYGICDYVFTPEELKRKLREIIRRRRNR